MKKEEDEIELNLELSVGGRYGETEVKKWDPCGENNEGRNLNNFNDFNVSRSDFSLGRKQIQALRRLEARKKREEKLKRSRKVGYVSENNNKLILEAHKCEARDKDRRIKEKDGFLEEKIRKEDKIGKSSNEVVCDLNLPLLTENKDVESKQIGRECLDERVEHGFAYPKCGVKYWEREPISNRSLEQSSSAVSDYQSTSHIGGSTTSDTGSLSSPLRLPQYHRIPKNPFDQHLESNDSSCQTEPGRRPGVGPTKATPSINPHSSWPMFFNKPKPAVTCSASDNLIKPPMERLNSIPRMPCVLTTGNGPHGKTIRGVLYKYTKTEVSIICVCHGSSFSPAEFVEHAGGVDIAEPLKNITIVPPSLR